MQNEYASGNGINKAFLNILLQFYKKMIFSDDRKIASKWCKFSKKQKFSVLKMKILKINFIWDIFLMKKSIIIRDTKNAIFKILNAGENSQFSRSAN